MNTNNTNFKTMKINSFNLNFMKTSEFFLSALLCFTLVTSCSDDDDNPAPINPEELITDVTLTFINNADASDVVTLYSEAPDGQDGTSIETITGSFTSGATYSLTLSILNASETPAEDILNEDIVLEADEHFFAYAVNGIDLTMTRDGDDLEGPNGSKLGLNTTWVAGTASTGNVQIILTHEPTSVDDSNGFGSATGGSQDLNLTFTGVVIQ
jgi:hypothetical protein